MSSSCQYYCHYCHSLIHFVDIHCVPPESSPVLADAWEQASDLRAQGPTRMELEAVTAQSHLGENTVQRVIEDCGIPEDCGRPRLQPRKSEKAS